MADKYYQSGTDVTLLAEPKPSATNYTTAAFNSYFQNDTQLQAAGTNTVNVTLPNYFINDTACTAVKNGYFPTRTYLTSLGTGTYTITRTDTALTIGSTTYTKDDFRCNSIPHELLVFVVGGGGGGGGNGYWKRAKNDYARTCSGAGGGGGAAVGRIKLDSYPSCTVTVGSGGGAGSNGASDSNSKGSAGTNGGNTSVTSGSTTLLSGYGGTGGSPGDGSSGRSKPGDGGAGGQAYHNTSACQSSTVFYAGSGNSYGNHTAANCASLTFTPTLGTGQASETFISSKSYTGNRVQYHDMYSNGTYVGQATTSIPYNFDDSEGDGSYFCGGCSEGRGAIPSVDSVTVAYINGQWVAAIGTTTMSAGLYGGGGGGGSMKCAGARGVAYFYY